MTNLDLNRMLLKCFPELIDEYKYEVSWQQGDKTGSHIVYGDVFTPYMVEQIITENIVALRKIFNFIEDILAENDKYASEVISFSVLEGNECLLWNMPKVWNLLGEKTKKELEGRGPVPSSRRHGND